MAAESKTRFDKQNSISFTLPISCQICLGKVKQPVLCPNNHVFCGVCMEVWLNRNQQCPACRVDINSANPIQQIRGGLNHNEEESDRRSTPQMRKARFELIYKEYEDEFERLTADIQVLKCENEALRVQIKKENGYIQKAAGDFTHPGNVDSGQVLALTRKLQDVQKQCDKLKQDLNRHKQENNDLKDENVNVNRENERLRVEIASRSPHRYGRFTVATLEAKVESYEKEINQLNKALERSDNYIEDLEQQLQSHGLQLTNDKSKLTKDYSHLNGSVLETKQEVDASKRRLFSDAGDFSQKSAFDKTDPVQFALDLYRNSTKNINSENDLSSSFKLNLGKQTFNPQSPRRKVKSSLSVNSPQKDKTPKKVQFDIQKDNDSTASSFDLDRPSPLTPSTYMGKLSLLDKSPGKPSSAKKQLNFGLADKNVRQVQAKSRELPEDTLDDTGTIKSELDELNISMTPELSDCIKLMNRAEKNVHVSQSVSGSNDVRLAISGTSHAGAPYAPLVSGMTFSSMMNEFPYTSQTNTSIISNTKETNPSFSNNAYHYNIQTNRKATDQPNTKTLSFSQQLSNSTSSKTKPPLSSNNTKSLSHHNDLDSITTSSAFLSGSHPYMSHQKPHPSMLHNDDPINQNFASLGISDMVKRGQNILKTLDLNQNQKSRSLPSLKTSHLNQNVNERNAAFIPDQFATESNRPQTVSRPYLQLEYANNTKLIPSEKAQFSHPSKFSSLPNFDIPQSLIIPSPNLSSEFANDKASKPSYPAQLSKGTRSSPSLDPTRTSVNIYVSSAVYSSLNSRNPALYSSAPISSVTSSSSNFLSFTGAASSSSSFLPKSYLPESHASTSLQQNQSLQPQPSTSVQQQVSNTGYSQQQVSNTGYNQQQVSNTGYNRQQVSNTGYSQQQASNTSRPTSSQQNVPASNQQYQHQALNRPTSSGMVLPATELTGGDNSINSLSFSGTGNSDSFRLEAPTGNYSYVSNDLSSRGSDSFLPEPKKRLFETDDDMSLSMSPIKTSRHY